MSKVKWAKQGLIKAAYELELMRVHGIMIDSNGTRLKVGGADIEYYLGSLQLQLDSRIKELFVAIAVPDNPNLEVED